MVEKREKEKERKRNSERERECVCVCVVGDKQRKSRDEMRQMSRTGGHSRV